MGLQERSETTLYGLPMKHVSLVTVSPQELDYSEAGQMLIECPSAHDPKLGSHTYHALLESHANGRSTEILHVYCSADERSDQVGPQLNNCPLRHIKNFTTFNTSDYAI